MKIAFNVDVLAKQMSITDMVHKVADWGYKYIEQSPHPRINPFYKHPLFSKECEAEYRKALREMDFANKQLKPDAPKVGGDNIACVSMFGFPEKMDEQAPAARERIERELLGK